MAKIGNVYLTGPLLGTIEADINLRVIRGRRDVRIWQRVAASDATLRT